MSVTSVKTCYTVRDLAARLNVSEGTIHVWRERGKIPAPLKFSGRLRWDVDTFEAWLAAQQEGGAHAE